LGSFVPIKGGASGAQIVIEMMDLCEEYLADVALMFKNYLLLGLSGFILILLSFLIEILQLAIQLLGVVFDGFAGMNFT
jgi:hypothetical protein